MTEGTSQDTAVVDVIEGLYAALGDRPQFDVHLDPDITIWESDAEGLLRGTVELDHLRDDRAARSSGAAPTSVRPEEILTDTWSDAAVARYVLRAKYSDETIADQCFRVTDVLRRDRAGWRIVHHHAEAIH